MNTLRLLPFVLLLAACQSGPDTTGKQSDGFPAPSKGMVWEAATQALREQGFVPDLEASNRTAGLVETRWRLSLQPFAGRGHRDKATVHIHDVPDRANYYRIETNVLRQPNDNMVEPSNPIAADWGDGVRMKDVEVLINRRIEMYFLPSDVSPRFRERYSMPAGSTPRIEGEKDTDEETPEAEGRFGIPGLR